MANYPMGWEEEWFDGRDHYYVPQHRVNMAELPKVNLKADDNYKSFWQKQVYNQSPFGTCVANACAAAFAYGWKRQGLPDFDPSRLFIFYNARNLGHIAGGIGSDPRNWDWSVGTYVRLAMKVLKDFGVCDSSVWPYDGPSYAQLPSQDAFRLARNNVAVEYARLDPDNPGGLASTLTDAERATVGEMALLRLRQCIAEGFPVVFGFYFPRPPEETFTWDDQAKEWAVIDLPPAAQRGKYGAHAALAVGYDDEKKRILCLNSWGEDVKMAGAPTFQMGYDWFRDFDATADFWMLRLVQQEGNRGRPIVVPREVKL